MNNTIKAAITALKNRIADAYTAVSAKGGTLPATQDSTNLPAAINSIPSGGGGELQFPSSDFFGKITKLGDGSYTSKLSITDQLWGAGGNYGDTISFDSLETIYTNLSALQISQSLIKKLRFPIIKENISLSYGFFVDNSWNVEYVYLGTNGKGNNLKYLFAGGVNRSKISDVEFQQGFGHSIAINDSTNTSIITRETIVSHILDRLYDFNANPLAGFTPTLTLGTWLSKLTTADIAIATAKGWTLA